MTPEIVADSDRIERERYDKFLSNLGFVHKGKFDPTDHDYSLDNYSPVGDCYIMLTLDSTKVLNCQISEYWEIQDTEDVDNDPESLITSLFDMRSSGGDFLEEVANTLKDLHYGAIAA